MERAAEVASAPADKAFAHYYLGELAWNEGDPDRAWAAYDEAAARPSAGCRSRGVHVRALRARSGHEEIVPECRTTALRRLQALDLRLLLERATRIELAFSAWEADVLPLNYARSVPGHLSASSG